jgi:hypothetical protein
MGYQQLLPIGNEMTRDNRELEDPASFMKAGKAVFTLVSEKTGKRFTFRVKKLKRGKHENQDEALAIYFVSVLTGQDNVNSYTYMGSVFGRDFRLTRNSKMGPEAPSFIAFTWFMKHIDNLPSGLKVYHENRCGRCGRALTVPSSVVNGFGPECIKKVS